ncbi:DUF2501 domain-containing protein [Allopusillimonas ginsengisoli]|uniref:DUF2501 domain-containing protein n=1 Tax=Allopusillimonas ginsengisoli TaxID=453575 RepID=UPI0010216FA8|nr:DUF2501 domain-containing protein [Allopusillimonas ginsengisoli]TEA79539.1 DUF2501 domain-containing protein [Allopusillimonas ginsengisoli]
MKQTTTRRIAYFSATVLIGLAGASQAQLLDSVKGALGSNQSASEPASGGLLGGLGSAGGLSIPSLGSVGTGNLTGVLSYCAKNNYLGSDAEGVKDKLLNQLGGTQSAQSDPGYQQGVAGILGGDSDQQVDLSGDGLKKQLTEKVCDQVLDYGKSLL